MFRRFVTMQPNKDGTSLRLVATLASGQWVKLSVPRALGEPPIEVRFMRQGDQLVVDRAGLPSARVSSNGQVQPKE
jgi:hypothetical protein